MKTKQIFGFVVAAIIALFAVNFAMASTSDVSAITGMSVEANDVVLTSGQLSVSPGDTIPVVVRFTSAQDLSDLKVKLEADNADAVTSEFDVVNGSSYVKRLSLTIPSIEDMDGSNDRITLHAKIYNSDVTEEIDYVIQLERDAHAFQFLQADAPMKASAGEIIAIDVVLENIGAKDADNAFVSVSIPELGVAKKAYFGDLVAQDSTDSNDNEDARERRIYVVIPSDAKSGDYTMVIKASNYDASANANKVITITGSAVANNSTAITATTSDKEGIPTSIIVLTVVLVIIFVVLLIVLIVLLTKKPSDKVEDFNESYY